MPVILVPRRPDNGPRDRIWAFTKPWWQQLGWPIVEGDYPPGPPCCACARNDAAYQAGNWDVALHIDADVLLADHRQAVEAVAKASTFGALVYAHDHLSLLTEEGTGRLLEGAPLEPGMTDGTRHPNTWSSAYAISRILWNRVRGNDERFVGWGWDDLALMASCMALGRVERVQGDAYHVWHPRTWEENEGSPTHADSMELGQRYLAAKSSPTAMVGLLAER